MPNIPRTLASACIELDAKEMSHMLIIGPKKATKSVKTITLLYLYSNLFRISQNYMAVEKNISKNIIIIMHLGKSI